MLGKHIYAKAEYRYTRYDGSGDVLGTNRHQLLTGLGVWGFYYLGQLLICVGVAGALEPTVPGTGPGLKEKAAALVSPSRVLLPPAEGFAESAADFGVVDDRKHLAMLQLRIVLHAVFGALHHSGDNARVLTLAHDVVAAARARPLADDGVEFVLIFDPRFIGGKPGIEGELRLFHHAAQRLELCLRFTGDEYPPVLADAVIARAAIGVVGCHLREHGAIARREIRPARLASIHLIVEEEGADHGHRALGHAEVIEDLRAPHPLELLALHWRQRLGGDDELLHRRRRV